MSHARTQVSVLLHIVVAPGAYETDNCSLSNSDLSRAVDLEVIKQWSNIPSETTSSCNNFRMDLSTMRVVCSQDLMSDSEVGCTSFPTREALRCAQ
jgi:hypothetical protein